MDLLHAIILSIIEGITEFLPISSTGHMILAGKLFNIPQTEFVKSFEVIIQLGAILAVATIYIQTLLHNKKLWIPLLIAFLPTAVIGFTLYPLVKTVFLETPIITVISLFIGGIILLCFDRFHTTKATTTPSTLTPKNALIIGLFQSVSIIPGVSRAAATIVGGMLTGLSKVDAVEFSFLLALPTMMAATGFDILKNYDVLIEGSIPILLVGFITAWVTAWISVKTFLTYVKTHSFVVFGWYRILLAILFACFVLR